MICCICNNLLLLHLNLIIIDCSFKIELIVNTVMNYKLDYLIILMKVSSEPKVLIIPEDGCAQGFNFNPLVTFRIPLLAFCLVHFTSCAVIIPSLELPPRRYFLGFTHLCICLNSTWELDFRSH